jgi:hypothetical protein
MQTAKRIFGICRIIDLPFFSKVNVLLLNFLFRDSFCHLSMVVRHLTGSLSGLMQVIRKILTMTSRFTAHRVLAFVHRWIGPVLRRQFTMLFRLSLKLACLRVKVSSNPLMVLRAFGVCNEGFQLLFAQKSTIISAQ